MRALHAIYAPSSRDAFVRGLHETLDRLIRDAERQADRLQTATEEQVTQFALVGPLSAMGYRATTETAVRGHADIVVQDAHQRFDWLGEAKVHESYDEDRDCLAQLLTRRTTGREEWGGVFLYVRNQDARRVEQELRRRLEADRAFDLATIEEDAQMHCFVTVHTHSVSGEPFRVRHHVVHLHFKPLDKAAAARR